MLSIITSVTTVEIISLILIFFIPFVILLFLFFKKFFYCLIVFLPTIVVINFILLNVFLAKIGIDLDFFDPQFQGQYRSLVIVVWFVLVLSLLLFPVALFFDIRKKKKIKQNLQ